MSISDPVVSLNVGGHIYTTARSTLTRYRDSMLGAMFGGDFDTAARDDQGRYFIDRNGRLFEHVLNFLRTTQLVLPEDFKELRLLEMEADFYQIQPLIEALKTHKARLETGPCDVVVLSHRHNPYHPFSVAASSKEVKAMVIGLYTWQVDCEMDDNIAALLGKLRGIGFILQSHVIVRYSDNSLMEKCILERKGLESLQDIK
ncbi:BTB/POZ domain-containing protein KCTD21-like [Branchiostoma floridae]|uniref:BTB/POZ domain-containing protein KCTD21-like n=1 Tax=Branchiostoma floridae TaxID=7739 RepID=A0A9J7HSY5_BRAFL|nr:BTB/POZ domain-containing protein KCTD21-like [Branchiostoma floridae]